MGFKIPDSTFGIQTKTLAELEKMVDRVMQRPCNLESGTLNLES
jgi:hypothetical protein